VGGLIILFLLGAILSRLTLRYLKSKGGQELQATGFERLLRSVYRSVIVLASAYYYVSLPVLLLIVVVVFGGAAYLSVTTLGISLRLLLFLGIAGLGTLYAVIQAIFARARESEPGRELTRDEAPELWQLAEQVAEKIGTRPIDHIYIVPGAQIAVTERGSMLNKLRDRGRRLLIVGLAALDGMTEGQFRAILAHEYGHFSGRDTAGGEIAYTAQASMQQMATNLADSGQARPYNPAWLFLNGYYRIFLRITQGASRLQEILADRIAATAYGCENLLSALRHVIRRSMEFDYQTGREAITSRQERRAMNNLYSLPPPPEDAIEEIDRKFKLELERSSSPYDSHPSYRERVDCLEALGLAGSIEGKSVPAAALVQPMGQLQQEMTQVVQKYVAPFGY
jgi:Zn-dependent protease with chaperone function